MRDLKQRKESNTIESKNTITIIDAPPGCGKTTWAIQEMNKHPEQLYVYCTPFLGEIDRIKQSTASRRFKEPEFFVYREEDGEYLPSSKLSSFNQLLNDGVDIAVSHSTFLNATEETISLIRDNEYILIIDEALEVVTDFNRCPNVERDCKQSNSKRDYERLIADGTINVNPTTGFVTWTSDTWQGGKFSELEKLVKLGRVYYVRGSMMVCVYPPEIFSAFKKVYALTYGFPCSYLKPYFQKFDICYDMASVEEINGEYRMTEYTRDYDLKFRQMCKKLIAIHSGENTYRGKGPLSKTWFETKLKEPIDLKPLQAHLQYFFRYIAKARASKNEIMWTCPKVTRRDADKTISAVDLLKGQGYTMVRQITQEEKKLPAKEREELEKKLSCFVPSNAKATNIYKDRWALAYCFNFNPNPMFTGFFSDYDSDCTVNEKAIAAGALIQWVMRSRLRDGKRIMLFLPSDRMETILRDWMDGGIW